MNDESLTLRIDLIEICTQYARLIFAGRNADGDISVGIKISSFIIYYTAVLSPIVSHFELRQREALIIFYRPLFSLLIHFTSYCYFGISRWRKLFSCFT